MSDLSKLIELMELHHPGPAIQDYFEPGIVRFLNSDEFDGMVVGSRAPYIVELINFARHLIAGETKLNAIRNPSEEMVQVGARDICRIHYERKGWNKTVYPKLDDVIQWNWQGWKSEGRAALKAIAETIDG